MRLSRGSNSREGWEIPDTPEMQTPEGELTVLKFLKHILSVGAGDGILGVPGKGSITDLHPQLMLPPAVWQVGGWWAS